METYIHRCGQCGICNIPYVDGSDHFITLIGNREGTSCHRIILDNALIPRYYIFGPRHSFHPIECELRNECAETVTVHSDCYAILRRTCGDLPADRVHDGLWILAAWRRAWRLAPIFYLGGNVDLRLCDVFIDVAERLGVSLLALPPELAMMVYEFVGNGLMSRCVAATAAAHAVRQFVVHSPNGLPQAMTMPLGDVSFWERGSWKGSTELPVALSPVESARLPFVRVTVDIDGVRKIERFQTRPIPDALAKTSHIKPRSLRFVVEHTANLTGVSIYLKFGRIRLMSQSMALEKPLRTWDIPAPVPLGKFPGVSIRVMPQTPLAPDFYTIDLNNVTGLSFWFSNNRHGIIHIHPHTPEHPFSRVVIDGTCIYLPLPPKEKILGVGYQMDHRPNRQPRLMFHMKLAGKVMMGILSRFTGYERNWIMSKLPPRWFVYNVGQGARSNIFAAATHPDNQEYSTELTTERISLPHIPPNIRRYYFHSIAPLNDVVRITTFHIQNGRRFQGLLLAYKNGGQRTLGECCLGVGDAVVYESPTHICSLVPGNFPGPTVNMRVSCTSNPDHRHIDEEPWVCYTMVGELIVTYGTDKNIRLVHRL